MGDDAFGRQLKKHLKQNGIDISVVRTPLTSLSEEFTS